MPARQGALTVVVPIIPERKADLMELLHEMAANGVAANRIFPFESLTSVHFARWFVIDDPRDHWRGPLDRPERPVLLVFSSNYDGKLSDHLNELFEVAAGGLNRILAHSVGFPSPGLRTREEVLRFMRSNSVGAAGFYRGTPGRTVVQVRYEADLRQRLERFLDGNRTAMNEMDPVGAREFIRAAFETDIQRPPPGKTRLAMIWKFFILVRILFAVLMRLPLVFFVRGLERKSDKRDRQEKVHHLTAKQLQGKHRRIRELADLEVPDVQNQMTLVSIIKPGRVRRWIVRGVLSVVNLLARVVFDNGQLGGITSIHFARWVVIGDGRFLLFMSNYDQSWQDYLGEFIDRASIGLSAIWSNTIGFPRTKWLVQGGAKHAAEFKSWARNQQLPTQVWYSAYPGLSVRNVNANTKICAGLHGDMNQQEAREWLSLL